MQPILKPSLLGTALSLALADPAVAAPLKIALVETLSGPQASTGKLFVSAARYGIERINTAGGFNGEPIQVLEYDNQGGPVGASDKVKAAINDGAHIIIQGSSSAIAGQITEDVRKHNLRNRGKEVLYLNAGGEALELTGEKCHFYHFRFTSNAPMRVKPLVEAMKATGDLGKRVYSINQNYSWGQDMERAITEMAPIGGYTVVEKVLHDVNKIQDFAPYVAKIKAANVDTVITGNWSNDLLLLMKASADAGLKVRFGTTFLDQVGNLANAGAVALGHYVAHPYNAEAAGDAGKRFVEDYARKTGHAPVYTEPQTVNAMAFLAEALKSVKPGADGRIDATAIAKALETTRIETDLGPLTIRAADHQAELPIVVSQVSKDAVYKIDGTDMGFKPVKVFSGESVVNPVQSSCRMQRPD